MDAALPGLEPTLAFCNEDDLKAVEHPSGLPIEGVVRGMADRRVGAMAARPRLTGSGDGNAPQIVVGQMGEVPKPIGG
jgi:hypothetical protein